MTTFDVRLEGDSDRAAIRHVHESAFPTHEEADLVDALRIDGYVGELCLVAADDGGNVLGHIAFSAGALEPGEHPLLVLAPMAVLPEHQRSGVGAALIRAGLERAAATTYPLVSVLGHRAYYPRFGFEPARPLGIEAPFEVPDSAWMAYRLPAWTAGVSGTVRYPKAFGALS